MLSARELISDFSDLSQWRLYRPKNLRLGVELAHMHTHHTPHTHGRHAHVSYTAFLTALGGAFPQKEFPLPHGYQPMGIVHALKLLNVARQASKSTYYFFFKSLV